MAKLTKEERARNQRRRSRQLVGVIISLFVVVGCVATLRMGANVVATVFDDTEQKAEYQSKLMGLVLFDPLPFDGVSNMQDSTLREAAIWGTLYQIMATETGLSAYDRDSETDQVLLPSLEVDAYLAQIFGSEFQLGHKTFEMDGMKIAFDETLQCYYIPITSVVGLYTPVVDSLEKISGQLHVTVGYQPVKTSEPLLLNEEPPIAKYMDYIFERSGGKWYLVALQESAKEAPAQQAQSSVASSSVPSLEDFEAVVLEDLANSNSASDASTSPENDAAEDDSSAANADDASTADTSAAE